jgi:hypothetical protein
MGRKSKLKRTDEHKAQMAAKEAMRAEVSRGIKACRDEARAAGRPLGSSVAFRPKEPPPVLSAPEEPEGKMLPLDSPEDIARAQEILANLRISRPGGY